MGRILSETYTIDDCYKYVTDFTSWHSVTKNGDLLKFSDFELPSNHRIEIKLKNASGICIVLGDYSHESGGYFLWQYAWYIGLASLYRLYYSTGYQTESYHNESNSLDTTSVYAIELDSTDLKTYKNTTNLSSVTGCVPPVNDMERLIRFDANQIGNIDWIKVRQL